MNRKISIHTNPVFKKNWEEFLNLHKDIVEPSWSETVVMQLPLDQRADVAFGYTDVAFNSSIAILSYSLKQGYFGLSPNDSDLWFKKFLAQKDRESQIELINQLHFNALKNCSIYPIGTSPYIAVSNKSWKVTLNPYFAATPLWLIRKI